MINITENQIAKLSDELYNIMIKMKSAGVFNAAKEVSIKRFHEFYQVNVDMYTRNSVDPIACSKGCFYCCNLHVDTFPGEMTYILDRYRKQYRETAYKEVVKKGKIRHEATKDLSVDDQRNFKQPCPFLRGTLCSIYEYRPMSCRSMVVADTPDLCIKSYVEDTEESVPFLAGPKLLQAFMSMALIVIYEDISFKDAILKCTKDQDKSWKSMQEAIVEYSNLNQNG